MPVATEDRLAIGKLASKSYRAMNALDRAALQESAMDKRLLNLILVRASQIIGCSYCLDAHSRDARAAGERQQRLDVLAGWREAPFFSDRERAALQFTDALTKLPGGDFPEAVYEEAARHFEPGEISELIFAIATVNAWTRIAIGSGMVTPAAE